MKKFNEDNENENFHNSFTFGNRTKQKKINYNNNVSISSKNYNSKNLSLNEEEESENEEEDIIFEELKEEEIINLSKKFHTNKFKKTQNYILNKINSNLIEIFSSPQKSNLITKNIINKSNNNKIKNMNNNNINDKKLIGIKNSNKKLILNPEKKKLEKCKCKNSQCLKLYCECFSNGRTCKNCDCIGCKNKIENEEMRKNIYNEIILKNPKAIQKIKSIKRSWTCHCKNSNCKKNYCDCFQNKKYCSSKCKCIDCLNKNLNNNNNKKRRGLDHFPKIKKGKSKKKNNKVDLENSFEKMYTPQKKNYRSFNSEIKNNVSTANTQLIRSDENNNINCNVNINNVYSSENKNKNNDKNIFKKLNMDDVSESLGIFKKN